jgi:hypothetical protein
MENLILFEEFSSRRRYYEQPSTKIEKIRQKIDSLTPEVDWIYGKDNRGSDWMQAVSDDPEGGLRRLLVGTAQAVLGVGQGISDKFGDSDLKGKSKEQLQKSREETIEKWGEKLEKSKKNTSTDFEIFYKDAIARGKNIFGRNFDLRKPKTDEEKIYAEYIEDAIKYYRD